MTEKGLISINEAVARTGYSRQQVYNLVRAKKIVAEKRGGWQFWVNLKSLAAYCERQGKTLAKAD